MKPEKLFEVLLTEQSVERAKDLIEKRAELVRIKPVVREYQTRILAENKWINTFEKEWLEIIGCSDEYKERIILSPDGICWLGEKETDEFRRLCFPESIKAGFDIESEIMCPLESAEFAVKQAEKEFINCLLQQISETDEITYEELKFGDIIPFESVLEQMINIIKKHLEID